MPSNNRLYTLDGLLRQGIYDELKSAFIPVDKVLIPKIQRPYAQGRMSQKDIRSNFLDDIFDMLKEPGNILELNFVYGSLTDGTFELLDGQQRLTTLFLLSWYMAIKEPDTDEIMSLLGKFTYETRTTSTTFIKKLIDKKLTIEKLSATKDFSGTTPGKFITSLGWYTGAFSKDSTVTGMLEMLDAIDQKFKETESDTPLSYSDLSRIQFYLLNLKSLGLTDELFIKMNARGLQLTPFENFKAELSGWLRSDPFGDVRFEEDIQDKTEKIPYWLFFCSSMDGKWTDRFWEKPANDNIDDLGAADANLKFFTFIKRWLANRAVTLGQEPDKKTPADGSKAPDWIEFFRYFNEQAKANRYHSFSKFREFVVVADEKGYDIVNELAQTLTYFSDPDLRDIIENAFIAPWTEKGQKPWDTNFDMRPMIIFSAISEFILLQPFDIKDPHSQLTFDKTEFRRWMRMVHNVVENRNIDSERPQLGAIRQLKDVLNINDNPVYQRLLDFMDAAGRESNREFREEAAKIRRIFENPSWQKGSDWEDAFIEAEKDEFLTGSVAFYLDDATDVETFRNRTKNVPILFNGNGVIDAFCKGYPLWRAILARDVDWSGYKFDSYIMRITNKVSGNRFLKTRTVWNESPEVRRLFSDIFDKDTADEMRDLLDNVAKERNSITFPDNWSDEVKSLAESGLANLCKEGKDGGALGWLSSVGFDPMGVYLYKNGVMALYRGNVNCMYLNDSRESIIPALEKALENSGFTVRYRDHRFKNSYDRFGLYSGQQIELYVSRPKSEPTDDKGGLFQTQEEYLLYFSPHFSMYVYAEQNEAHGITGMIKYLKSEKDTPDLTHIDIEKALYDENGNHETYSVDSRLLYLAAYIPDIRNINPEHIIKAPSIIQFQ